MNWNRYSKIAIALVVLLGAAAPVAAVSVSGGDVPETVQVGQTQDVTYTVSDLYTSYDTWTLKGQTDLEQVTWTVTTYDVGGAQIDQTQYNAQNFSHPIAKSDDVAEVRVRLQGTTPEWSNWSFDPAQSLVLARFSETQQGGASSTIATDEARPYTEDSQNARQAIESATAAIDAASSSGADPEEAQGLIDNAVSAYDNGNFENAQSLAEQAQTRAEGAQQSTEQTNLLLMVGGVVIALLIVAGIVYWYLNQRDTYDKLG